MNRRAWVLLKRAWDLARHIKERPELVRRYTRLVLTQHLKRRMLDDLGSGPVSSGVLRADR